MNVEITLNDEDGDPTLEIANCDKEGFVILQLLNTDTSFCQVSIENLKLALRKLTVK